MTYPRERNGWVDDGAPLSSSRNLKCPNCGSSNYKETISMEKCNSCGLVCDYWGGGTNAVYESYLANHYAREQAKEDERRRAEEEQRWDEDDY